MCEDPKQLRDRARRLPARPRAHGHPAPRHQRLRPRALPPPGRAQRHPARALPDHGEPDAVAVPQRAGGRRRPPDQAHRAARAPVRGGLAAGARAIPEEPPQPRRPHPPLHAHRAHRAGPGPARPEGSRPCAALRLGDDRPRPLQVRQRPLRPSRGRPRAGHAGRPPAPAPAPVRHHRALRRRGVRGPLRGPARARGRAPHGARAGRVPRDRPRGAGQAAASGPPSARAWPCWRRERRSTRGRRRPTTRSTRRRPRAAIASRPPPTRPPYRIDATAARPRTPLRRGISNPLPP